MVAVSIGSGRPANTSDAGRCRRDALVGAHSASRRRCCGSLSLIRRFSLRWFIGLCDGALMIVFALVSMGAGRLVEPRS